MTLTVLNVLRRTVLFKEGRVFSPFAKCFDTNFAFTYICEAVFKSKLSTSQLDDNRHFIDGNIMLCVCMCVRAWCYQLTHWGRGHLNCLNARSRGFFNNFNPLNAELNPICYLLALLAYHFLHVSRIRIKSLTLRLLMSYIYGAPILDVSRSHTMTQHIR